MQKTIYGLAVVMLLLIGYAYIVTSRDMAIEDRHMSVYSDGSIGLRFEYPGGTSGYVVDERMPVDTDTDLVRVILLTRFEDTLQPIPVGGEGPPMISISVFTNNLRQSSSVWADRHQEYSIVHLAQGDIQEAVVGGANAVRYMADGLYRSENVVVANGSHMYVITGQFFDMDSDLRRDYVALLETIQFIPETDE